MRPPSRPAASSPPRSPPGGCPPPPPGAADRGPPRERQARTLPLRVPPVPGEAIDSWLEALARRSQVTVGTLTAALGWPLPASPGGLVAGIPGQVLRRLEHQAGLAAGRLDDAVLDRYLPLGPVRRRGSRYCPSCLAERDGRWLLSWRLGWVFACTTHDVLLCDTCPACGSPPAAGPAAPGSTRPAAAPAPSSGTSTAARTCAR